MTGHDTREVKKAELGKKPVYLIGEAEIYLERTEDPIRRSNNEVTPFMHSSVNKFPFTEPVTILDAGALAGNRAAGILLQ